MSEEEKEEILEDEPQAAEDAEDRGDEVIDPEDELEEDLDEEEELPEPEEPEADSEEDSEEEPPEPVMIPKGRFDERTRQLQEIKDENAWLKQQLEKVVGVKEPPPSDEPKPEDLTKQLAEKKREYYAAIADGDIDYAMELDEEITTIQEQEIESRARRHAEKVFQEKEAKRQEQEADKISEQIIADHPELLDDQELLEEFRYAQGFAQQKGMTLAESLRAAEKRLFGNTRSAPAASKQQQRKKEAVKRNIKAEQSQPPPSDRGAGERTTAAKRRVSDMSEDEFERLSEKEKKALRGD